MKLEVFGYCLTVTFHNKSKTLDDKLQRLVAGGFYVNALKLYREQTGATLKDAKAHIDSLPKLPDFMHNL